MNAPYIVLTGVPWGVCCEDFGEDLPRYNGNALYKVLDHIENIYSGVENVMLKSYWKINRSLMFEIVQL